MGLLQQNKKRVGNDQSVKNLIASIHYCRSAVGCSCYLLPLNCLSLFGLQCCYLVQQCWSFAGHHWPRTCWMQSMSQHSGCHSRSQLGTARKSLHLQLQQQRLLQLQILYLIFPFFLRYNYTIKLQMPCGLKGPSQRPLGYQFQENWFNGSSWLLNWKT